VSRTGQGDGVTVCLGEAARRALEMFGTPQGLDLEAVSDACDALGLGGFVHGLIGLWNGAPAIAGPAVTMELVCADYPVASSHHLGVDAVEAAQAGDVIVIDHRGRSDAAGWGGLLSQAAKRAGVRGVLVHGGARDVSEAQAMNLPLWGSSAVSRTARGRVVQRSVQQPIHFAGVAVRPGDVVFASEGGVVVVPADQLGAVLTRASDIRRREGAMQRGVVEGADLRSVLGRRYENMLEQGTDAPEPHDRMS